MSSEKSTFTRNITVPPVATKTSYGSTPLAVCYTNSPKSVSDWLVSNDLTTGCHFVGFDVESMPNVPWRRDRFSGPALIQISLESRCLLVQLVDNRGNGNPRVMLALEDFLASDKILKVGVGIDDDMVELYRAWPGKCKDIKGRLDISGFGRKDPKNRSSLKLVTSTILGVDLNKSKKLATSNWGKVPLEDRQLSYASRDAWSAAAIMVELQGRHPKTCNIMKIRKDVLDVELRVVDLHTKSNARKSAKAMEKRLFPDKKRSHDDSLPPELKKQLADIHKIMSDNSRPAPYQFEIDDGMSSDEEGRKVKATVKEQSVAS